MRLFEPEIGDDTLQRLHILHNLSRILAGLRTTDAGMVEETTMAKLNEMEIEDHAIQNNYISLAQAVHCQSKQQLCAAVKVREKCKNGLSDLS